MRLRRLLEELGPMFVKMGQILANRSEILPQRFCDELRRLRSDVDPVPYEVVLRCLEEEYGQRLGQMFDAIDPNPLGSASLAQVHRARLVTGEDVAVKVQRPGAQQVMAQDIDIIRSVVRIVSKFVNTDQFVDLHGVVEELWTSFREETNFWPRPKTSTISMTSTKACTAFRVPNPTWTFAPNTSWSWTTSTASPLPIPSAGGRGL